MPNIDITINIFLYHDEKKIFLLKPLNVSIEIVCFQSKIFFFHVYILITQVTSFYEHFKKHVTEFVIHKINKKFRKFQCCLLKNSGSDIIVAPPTS